MKTIICPHCNQTHQAGSRFCPVTGQAIPEQLTCSSCGHDIQPGWKVCPECGGALDGVAKVEHPEQPSRKRLMGCLVLAALVIGIGALAGYGWWTGWLGELNSIPALSRVPATETEFVEGDQDGGQEEKPGPTEITAATITPTSASVISIGRTPTPLIVAHPTTPPLPVRAGTPYPQPVVPISAENAGQVVELARWGKGVISEVTYSPDGKLLAVATSIGIYLYDANTLDEVDYISSSSWVSSVAFSPDGGLLASGSGDGTVNLWRVADGIELRTLEGHTDEVRSVAFSPDGGMLASGSYDTTVRLWRVSDGSKVLTLEGHTNCVYSLTFSPDGGLLASSSFDNTVILWRVSDGIQLRTLEGHTDRVFSVAFSPDGGLLASGSEYGTVILWQVSDGGQLRTLAGHTINSLLVENGKIVPIKRCIEDKTHAVQLLSSYHNIFSFIYKLSPNSKLAMQYRES
jgi:WD40 repeat protein